MHTRCSSSCYSLAVTTQYMKHIHHAVHWLLCQSACNVWSEMCVAYTSPIPHWPHVTKRCFIAHVEEHRLTWAANMLKGWTVGMIEGESRLPRWAKPGGFLPSLPSGVLKPLAGAAPWSLPFSTGSHSAVHGIIKTITTHTDALSSYQAQVCAKAWYAVAVQGQALN